MAKERNYQIKKKWNVRKVNQPYKKVADHTETFSRLLASRGLCGEKEIEAYLRPDYILLSDPFELPGMKDAVETICKAIENGQKIAIYGDFDVDGVTATALLVNFFKDLGVSTRPYIPSRIDEGYGLNQEAIKTLADEGVGLIITVDCGCTSVEEVDYARSLGIDVVVTDHHTLRLEKDKVVLPQAAAVINPKRLGNESPMYELAGVAVAFYLVRALSTRYEDKLSLGQEKWYLDLVALGTICDIVPLTGENRILANYGLVVLSKSKRKGIIALSKVSEFELTEVDSYKVGFLLGPRLNAAGRIEHANASLELLTTDSVERAQELAHELNELNLERQEITERITNEAREMIEAGRKDKKIFLLAKEGWPSGVVGIVASRLVEEYGRPMLVMEDMGDTLRGSARSISGFNIVEALHSSSEYLSHFGGHAFAAGYSLPKEKFILLDENLIEIADGKIQETDFVTEIDIDIEISTEEITIKFLEEMALMEPLGRDNKKPVFAIYGVKIADFRLVGNPAVHLKLTLEQRGCLIPGIAFGYGEIADVTENTLYDVAVTLEVNEWNGKKKAEFRLIDIEATNE